MINDRKDPIVFQVIIKYYLKSRANFDISAIQLFSLISLYCYFRYRSGRWLIPCCFLLTGNIIYASAYYLQSLRMAILFDYIKNKNWKVYDEFLDLMYSSPIID
ncbi:unnamed protein product [Blepharisma stoltei]|uniref:Uncharacterized protein n=1 Tax=Blepharisma stoltei TaxID=1481888 RepID=A0AAU9K819_9CILI|nr:unnamed protein product [Blepharisma stoltei]